MSKLDRNRIKDGWENSAQTDRQTDRHYENNGHLAVNQQQESKVHIAVTRWLKSQDRQCRTKSVMLVCAPLHSGVYVPEEILLLNKFFPIDDTSMCGSMVDIQSTTAEIRRGKKIEDR